MKQFPWAYPLLKIIPPVVVSLFHRPGTYLFKIRNDIKLKIEETKNALHLTKIDEETGIHHNESQSTALYELLTSALPTPELQTPRLEDEAFTILGAGTITTAHALTTILYHILANPVDQLNLENEMDEVYSDLPNGNRRPSLKNLEQAPCLQAIVAEGLRLSLGVSHRLPRISPDTALHYSGSHNGRTYEHIIPPGIPVSMTPMFMHLDPDIFPSPHTFDPQRWRPSSHTEEETERLRRQRGYLVPFSKGTRSCAGMWLAYTEMYLMLSTLFSPGGVGRQLRLFDTSVEDVECVHDFFNPSPRLDSKGVRVTLKEQPQYISSRNSGMSSEI